MEFTLKFKEINEKRELKSNNYSIKNLLNDLELSSQTTVAKQNGWFRLYMAVNLKIFIYYKIYNNCY